MSSSITICGNLTRDPDLRRTGNGTPVASLAVAVNRRIMGKNGTTTDTVSYFNVVAWHGLAEHVASSLRRGARVVVTGRLDQRSWTSADESSDAAKRTVYELVADDVGASLRYAPVRVERPVRPVPELREPDEVTVVSGVSGTSGVGMVPVAS